MRRFIAAMAVVLTAGCGDDGARGPDAGPDAAPDAAAPITWARGFRGELAALALTPDGGGVLVGSFQGTVDFGGGPLTNAGAIGSDGFVAALSSGGEHRWSRAIAETDPLAEPNDEVVSAIAVDAAGDLYVAGSFHGTLDLGGQTLTADRAGSGFLVELDGDTGAVAWARSVGRTAPRALAVTADGRSIGLCGDFAGSVDLGGGAIASNGSFDAFVVVLDGTGQHAWSRGLGGADADGCAAIAMVGTADVVIAGRYTGPASFGAGPPLAAAGAGVDAVIARYDDGVHTWSRGFGGAGPDGFRALAVHGDELHAGGGFEGPASFGGAPLAGHDGDGGDGVIARYATASGAHLWSRELRASQQGEVWELAADAADVWFAGTFVDTVTAGALAVSSAGGVDVFVGRAAAGDGVVGSLAAIGGGPGVDTARGIGLTSTHVWVAGTFEDPLTLFGSELTPFARGGSMFVGRTAR